MVPSTRATFKLMSAPLRMFMENIMTRLEKVSECQKSAKIEGYNSHFRTFSVSELQTLWNAFSGHGTSLESSHMTWNEYMDAFTFISRQFWV